MKDLSYRVANVGLLTFGVLALASCSSSHVDSSDIDTESAVVGASASALLATNADSSTMIKNIGDPGNSFLLLISKNRGYRLVCDNTPGRNDLIKGVGLDPLNVLTDPPI